MLKLIPPFLNLWIGLVIYDVDLLGFIDRQSCFDGKRHELHTIVQSVTRTFRFIPNSRNQKSSAGVRLPIFRRGAVIWHFIHVGSQCSVSIVRTSKSSSLEIFFPFVDVSKKSDETSLSL